MILVCDLKISERALSLRDRIFDRGCPCAVSGVDDIQSQFPVKVIITFADVFGEIRRRAVDDVLVVAIGIGFVNSALNAVRVDTPDEALETAYAYIIGSIGVENADRFAFGVLRLKQTCFSRSILLKYGADRCFLPQRSI